MNRRAVIYVTGSTVLTSLTGCLGSSSQTNTETTTMTERTTEATTTTATTTTPEPTTATSDSSEQAAAALEDARTHLRTAVEKYEETTSTMFSQESEVSFNIDPILVALENARDDLSRAKTVASEEQHPTISMLSDYADMVEQIAKSLQAVSKALNHYYTATAYEESRRYETAASELETGMNAVDTASDRQEAASKLVANLQEQALESQEVEYETTVTQVSNLGDYITGLKTLFDGGIDFDHGLADSNTATKAYEDGEYESAADSYEKAHNHFRDASETFKAGEDDAGQSLRSRIIYMSCYADNYKVAMEKFRKASQAAENEDWDTANTAVEEGEQALNRSC